MSTQDIGQSTVERALLFFQQHIESQREQQVKNLPKNGKSPMTADDIAKDQAFDEQIEAIQKILKTNSESVNLFPKSGKDFTSPPVQSHSIAIKSTGSHVLSDSDPYINPLTGQWIYPVMPYAPGPSASENFSEESASIAAERSKAIIDSTLASNTSNLPSSSTVEGSQSTRDNFNEIMHQMRALETCTQVDPSSPANSCTPANLARTPKSITVLPPAKLYNSFEAGTNSTDNSTFIRKASIRVKRLKNLDLFRGSRRKNKDAYMISDTDDENFGSMESKTDLWPPALFNGRSHRVLKDPSLDRENSETTSQLSTISKIDNRNSAVKQSLSHLYDESKEAHKVYGNSGKLTAAAPLQVPRTDHTHPILNDSLAIPYNEADQPAASLSASLYHCSSNYVDLAAQSSMLRDDDAIDLIHHLSPSLHSYNASISEVGSTFQQRPVTDTNKEYSFPELATEIGQDIFQSNDSLQSRRDKVEKLAGSVRSRKDPREVPNETPKSPVKVPTRDSRVQVSEAVGLFRVPSGSAFRTNEEPLLAEISLQRELLKEAKSAKVVAEETDRAEAQAQLKAMRRVQEEFNTTEAVQMQNQIDLARLIQDKWNVDEEQRFQDQLDEAQRLQDEMNYAEQQQIQDELDEAQRLQDELNAADEQEIQYELDRARILQNELNAAEEQQILDELEKAQQLQDELNKAEELELRNEIEAARRMEDELNTLEAQELAEQQRIARTLAEEYDRLEQEDALDSDHGSYDDLSNTSDHSDEIGSWSTDATLWTPGSSQPDQDPRGDTSQNPNINTSQASSDELSKAAAIYRQRQNEWQVQTEKGIEAARAAEEEIRALERKRRQRAKAAAAEAELRARQQEQAQREAQEEAERQRLARQAECIADCGTRADRSEMVITACNHAYCRDCIAQAFQVAFDGKTLYSCCGNLVPVDIAARFLSRRFIAEYRLLALERETPNPVYCAAPNCSTFLPPASISGDAARCTKCEQTTCRLCKQLAHQGVCAEDTAGQGVLDLARRERWQACGRCQQLVEKAYGCVHMTCRCGYHFCYVCGGAWGTVCNGSCPRAQDWVE